ncbi:hypothetical protein BC332_19548 [Capsicum chinense]|nr:hypothetical protein BC332_19548 [Capsicum chinense]
MAKNKKRGRSSATSRRLKMYNNRPKRDRKGKILKHEYQSKHLQLTRIQPDPRWFSDISKGVTTYQLVLCKLMKMKLLTIALRLVLNAARIADVTVAVDSSAARIADVTVAVDSSAARIAISHRCC